MAIHPEKRIGARYPFGSVLLAVAGFACLLTGAARPAAAQTFTYDFGGGTGAVTTGADLPTPTSGTAYGRVGTGGGSLTLDNPGIAALGSGSELAIVAPTGGTVNKFDLYGYTGATTSRLAFSAVIGGNSGTFNLCTGTGPTFSSATTLASAQTFTGLQFVLGGTVGAPTVTTMYRSGNSLASTGMTTTGITAGAVLGFDIYGNNSASGVTYTVAGTAYMVAAGTQDIFLNGTLIGNDLPEAQLASGTTIDSFMFYGASSTGNVGTFTLDDITYGAITATAPVPEPATVFGGILLIGAAFWNQRSRLRGLLPGDLAASCKA